MQRRTDDAERVILVDESDRPVGEGAKLDVHRDGLLHRAISVVVTDGAGRVLLQRRAEGKYHSAGMWSNTCCGHPRPEETTHAAASRRLLEEMGILCALVSAGSFTYRGDLGNGLVEHEIDHVFVGRWSARPHPDPLEVSEWRWADVTVLRGDIAAHPTRYTVWLASVLATATAHPSFAAASTAARA